MTSEPSFFDIVRRQRACRAFAPDPVDDATVERILEAATFAPSAENSQPWVFVIVRDASVRAAVGDLTRRAWEGGARAYEEDRLTPGLLADVDRGATGGVAGAPVLVVVGADTSRVVAPAVPSSIWPAVQNLLLAATAAGLGSSLTTLATAFEPELRDLVGLPDHVRPVAVIPLGHPARAMGPPKRRPFTEATHRDRFGQRWVGPPS